jgi:hypothetical protein
MNRAMPRLYSQSGGTGPALDLDREENGGRSRVLEWNVVLQGPEETVFFDLGL